MELWYKIDDRTRATTWLSPLDKLCPICGHIEAWSAVKSGPEVMQGLTQKNIPCAFTDVGRAYLWAFLGVQENQELIEAQRAQAGDKQIVHPLLLQVHDRIKAVKNELPQEDKKNICSFIEADIARLNLEMEACKFSERKRKNELKLQIDGRQKQLNEVKAEINRREAELKKEHALLCSKQNDLRCRIMGNKGSVIQRVCESSWSFQLTPGEQK